MPTFEKNGVQVVDPGALTMKELKTHMSNKEQIPLWMMHPLAQHVLRVLAGRKPDLVQIKTKDDSDWRSVVSISPEVMLMEAYRIKIKAGLTMKMLNNMTGYNMWNNHRLHGLTPVS